MARPYSSVFVGGLYFMNDAVVGVVRVVIEKYMTTLWETTFCNSEAAGLQMSIPVLRMARSINAPAQI
jgi:hypothetical protein